MADVNFNVSNPYQTQLDELTRRQKMAEMMQQQAFQPTERFSYGGIEARTSPLSGLAKALQMYMGASTQKDIADERKAVGARYQSDLVSTLGRANELAMGKPATPDQAPITSVDDEGNINPMVAGSPAVAPNRQAAAMEYFKHPALQPMGMAEMQKNAQTERFLRAGNLGGQTPMPGTPSAAGSAEKPIASVLSKFGQPAGGQPMAVWMEIDPSGKLYTEQLAKEFTEVNKPTDTIRNLRAAGIPEGSPQWKAALSNINTAGGIFQPDETGGVRLAPGFATGAGEISGSEAAAKAANAISTREVGGRNVTGTDRQFKILAEGQAPTETEAQSVAEWANRSGIQATIRGPMPTGSQSAAPIVPGQSGMQNPTAAESAERKEFATGGAAAITKKLDASYDLAKNSVERITTLNDLKSVIDLPAFSGPGATAQLLLGQLANKFYGANNAETIANTTLKIQGLADLSLKAAGLIKGQGSVTEPERALLEKAKSAPVNLTVPEYRALFKLLEKQDATIIKEHQNLAKRAQKAGVPNIDFWSVDMPIPQGLNLSPAAQKLLKGG
jgi:hypothetical protein